ncbi:hypothetical protein LEP1GSC050_0025 [Leptospira phage vB_LbrZ_5399-LE1]|uniref:PAS domain S-box protein n=1 Tax=Leptospira inadai serovar Lyme TaxID=293084 RepID=A0ABX4YG99_9LEPT|nr:hypothetical protein [Leptospira inadai]AGS80781.1 hypothetical protein LEP1GSC050_0025 [Leptospira phage vB_LbrZ_5399-LE1]AGS80860.1 hypothetical protein LEP1GSC047_0846 [Leptospira phage vB_LinZ_10-LE1]PNV74291.1 hypothetical protein BES34_013980 [Leptospira inadai serovar Lyme]
MKRESPFSEYRFVRELTYAWLYYFLSLQWETLGNPKTGVRFEIEKAGWKDVFGEVRRKFFGQLLKRPNFQGREIKVNFPDLGEKYDLKNLPKTLQFPEGLVRRADLEKEDQAIFDFLAKDWNKVYLAERQKASILGYNAEYLLGHGEDPEELKDYTIQELSEKAKEYKLPGLEEIDKLTEELGLTKEQTYATLYGNSQGAKWLAIYNERGERSGKAYDLITKMYREQIVEMISRNATESEIRSLMVSPDDDEIKNALGLFEEGLNELERERREAEYETLVRTHLNRDMQRFAFTEISINFNGGRLLALLNEGEEVEYVKFTRGKR